MDDSKMDILKSYGLFYIEIDKEGNREEFVKGSLDDVFKAYKEIILEDTIDKIIDLLHCTDNTYERDKIFSLLENLKDETKQTG